MHVWPRHEKWWIVDDVVASSLCAQVQFCNTCHKEVGWEPSQVLISDHGHVPQVLALIPILSVSSRMVIWQFWMINICTWSFRLFRVYQILTCSLPLCSHFWNAISLLKSFCHSDGCQKSNENFIACSLSAGKKLSIHMKYYPIVHLLPWETFGLDTFWTT